MNLMKGTVRAGDRLAVEVNGVRMPFAAGPDAADGQDVLYGVRPEHLELSPDGFPARISVVEPTGSETMVFLRFGETELVALFRERHEFRPGDTLNLRPRPDLVHLFDAQTGRRL